MQLARISPTLSLHVSLSFIAFGRSSGLHPVSSHSCCMNVRAGRPAFDWPYAGVHRSTSLTITSLPLQQCPARLVRLACIDFVIGVGGRTVCAVWGVAARTCSILLATFLYNCRRASSPTVIYIYIYWTFFYLQVLWVYCNSRIIELAFLILQHQIDACTTTILSRLF